MSYLSPGLLEAYNSLTDKHLIGYFNNTRIRRHLRRAGLITRSGRIVPEKEYRQKLIHRAHQRHVRECLAQAIFHKVLDMERAHQTEIKKRLEEFARRERVYKIKVERSKRHDDDFIPMLSPRPPTGPRGNHTQQSGPEGDMSESTESPGSSRPNTAPGKMQRPVRLKPIDRNNTTASVKRTPPSSRNQDSSNDTDQPASLDRDMRHWSMREYNNTVSPYRLPVINNYVTPVPPQTKRRERGMRGTLNGTRGRRLRPTTAPTTPANMEDSALLRTSVQSKVTVTMVYFGRSVHLSHDLMDLGDEVKAFQQHCGGENLCVYKGRLREGETFQFISRRHRGFPFSLTFYLNGLQVDRLSSCCEFKHRKGSRLGGRHGHFGFFSVDGAQPCYKCIIAMGLDKKPTPPPKRVSDDTGSSQAIELCPESTQEPAEMQEDQVERTEPETETESTQPHSLKTEEEAMQDDQPKDDYEEDFEADDEGPVEDGGEEADGKSPSPTNEGKTEDEIQDAPEGETTEHNKHPAGEAEDEDKTDRRETRSVSSGAASSSSGSDAEDSEDEAKTKEADAAETAKTSEVALQQAEPETELPLPMETSDKDQQVEDAETMEVSSPVPTDTEAAAAVEHTQTQDSAGDSLDKTELEVSESTEVETAAAAAAVDEGTADPTGGSAAENEPERAKSVQEKLAEAILSEAHSSPEPELSDTSTEEEEEVSSEKTPQDTTVVEPETGMALSLLQPEKGPDKECEEGLKEISNEETGTLAGEKRGPSPENKEKEATDEQNLEAAEEPGVENEKTAEPEERVEPMDESSKVPLETPAATDCEKKEKEEMESTEAAETPGEAEIESEKKDQDIEENAKEQTEESSTIANETESADPENKEGVAEEMKETKDSEAPLEQQEKEEEGIEDSEETGEGEPVMSETEAHKTSEEPSESVAVVSEVAQSEEPSADDTKGEEGTPDDQNGVAESGTARADDATTHDATVLDDSTSADKNTVQEPDSCIVETSEKTSDTDIVGKENEENCEETLVDGKNIESDENTVKDGNDEQNTEEKDKAEEEKPDNVDERHREVQQETLENESAAMDKEDKIVDELREDKDTLVEAVENVEAVQEQATLDTGEQLEEDKVEEEAKEVDIKEDRHTENEVKSVGEDAKTSVSDGEKEKSEVEEEKNNTADRAVDGDERNSVSEGEKEKSVEGEKNRNMDVRESEDQEAKSEKDEPEGQEAKGEKEDTIVETIAEKETNKVTEKEIEADECGQGGDKVKDEEVDKPVNEQVDEREVEAEQTRKENEKEGEEEKEVKGSQHDEDQVQCAEKDNTKDRESGDNKTVDGAEEGSAPQDESSKVVDKAGETLKDDNTDTKVEEAERSEKDAAESIERSDSKTFDGERETSGGREEEDRKEEADNCAGDGDDDARSEKKEQRNENESETDRDAKGEDKDDVIQDKAVSRDGTESQHSENAEADGKVEVRIKRTPVFEFAITEQDKTEINDENGEKITASETTENEVKTSELGSEEPCQIVDKEQSGSSDRGEEEVTGTRIEEIVGDKQNDIEDINGDDAKSDRKLSSDGSAATQVKVEERKVKMVADVPDGSDDRTSVQSKTSKDSLSRHSSTKQDTDAANNDKKVKETSTEIEPFHFVQEIEGLNAVHTNAKVSDVPESTGSNPETKWHIQRPKDLEGKEDTSTKTGSREPDGTEKEHKVNGQQSVAESLTSPLPLEREEVGDLVSKWVNQHQTRGCFQTFVEPLDDMKETSSLSKGDGHMNGHAEKGEGSQATNMPESDTLDQMSEKKEDYSSPPMSALTEDKQETAVEDFVMETGEEKAESDVRDKHSSDESALATKDMSKDGQDNEIRDLKLTAETKYAKKDTASIATKDWENRPYEQGVLSDKVINQIAITKIKDDSKPDSESSSESASNAKRDNSVHSGHAQDTTMTKQQLKLEDVMPQSLSRDRLNTFSVEDSHLFGPTTYPRLATAHPEQSY